MERKEQRDKPLNVQPSSARIQLRVQVRAVQVRFFQQRHVVLDVFDGGTKDDRLLALPNELPQQVEKSVRLVRFSAQKELKVELLAQLCVHVQTN